MKSSALRDSALAIALAAGALLGAPALALAATAPAASSSGAKAPCPSSDNAGLTLPAGFCATVFADHIGHARHMAVSDEGVLYVNTWSGSYYPLGDVPPAGGFLLALKDQSGSGKADRIERFGETLQSGGHGGVGIGIYKGSLYAEINDRIVRYALGAGQLVPSAPAVTVVSGLATTGQHPMHPFFFGEDGFMYIDMASATNACQSENRILSSTGQQPCPELQVRGGIWRYDPNQTDQHFSPSERYATGIRNSEGFGVDLKGHRTFVTQHGRDELHTLWPKLYSPEQEATLPSEELLLLSKGADYGWPECYFDPFRKHLVLAPEYGGDGGKRVGVCADKSEPVAEFPAHWAPNAMVYYDHPQYPRRYQDGVFIAFHGSWNRAPYAQGGYNVVFQSLPEGQQPGRCEVFADGFAGPVKSAGKAEHRPTGLAVGPDGALYVSDDVGGRIYRIVYEGGAGDNSSGRYTACPSLTAPSGPIFKAVATAGAKRSPLPVPAGATREMVALGNLIYDGEVGGAPCTGCHGPGGTGTALAPDLTAKTWLWGDGSYASIAKVITTGVSMPKHYRSGMPPKGGADLSDEQIKALAAYVWALSHTR